MSRPSVRTSALGFESREPYSDPVIEAYKRDVDRTLIREMLKLTPEERILALQRALEDAMDLREAMSASTAQGDR